MEVNAAFSALGAAQSLDDLKQAIEEHPVISAPVFHAYIRQEYIRLHNEKSSHLQSFSTMYDHLFTLLHYRAHAKLCSTRKPAGEAKRSRPAVYAPPWLTAIAGILEGRLPSHEGSTQDPAVELDQIRYELAEVTGMEVEVPGYAPLAGSKWSAVIVACAACSHPWLTLRAYAVDLTHSPNAVEGALRAGRLNNDVCPTCGEPTCYPLRVWIQDAPSLLDPLAALTCVWRLSENLLVYQPPPGTPRAEENDRILEIRLEGLQRRLGWHAPTEGDRQGALVMSYGVAYSVKELVGYLDRVREPAPDLPMAMDIMIGEISRKIRTGQILLNDVETLMHKLVPEVGRDWPLLVPGSPADFQGGLHEFLVLSLIAEGVAQAQKQPKAVLVLMARGTVAGYLALGEIGLAEAALARAEDLLAAVPADEVKRELLVLSLAEARADLNQALGHQEEAYELRKQVKESDLFAGDTFLQRLTRERVQAEEALGYFESKQYAEALGAFPEVVENLRRLLEEATEADDPEISEHMRGVQYSLSGVLANWAATLTDLAEYMKILGILTSGLSQEEIVRYLLTKGKDPRIVLGRAAHYLQSALPTLEHLFPELCDEDALQEKAQSTLEEALALSETSKSWEFAGVQSHRLTLLLAGRGLSEEAVAAARKAITYAARAGDHLRIWSAQAFLADQALKRGDGPEALACLRDAAREYIRERIGLGHNVRRDSALVTLANAALQATEVGADKAGAVMIVESLKASTTAAALSTGIPLQPQEGEVRDSAGQVRELMQQRETLRLKRIWDPDNPDIARDLERVAAELERKSKALSLRDPRFRRWVDATDVEVSDAEAVLHRLQRIGPDTTLMGVLPAGNIVWTYALWEEGCIVAKRPWVADEWDSSHKLPQLAEAILAPLDSRLRVLQPGNALIISPFDPLFHVPFCALPYRGEPLCRHADISLIQGIGILEACLRRPAHQMETIMCVGEPKRPDMDALDGARKEAREIAELFLSSGRQALLLEGRIATVAALRSHAKDYDIIHFACHTQAAPGEGNSSCLMLAPDLLSLDSGELSEDRILTELLLLQGALVNLAGCSTGTQSAGDAPILGGLVPAFLVAGAGSVIGSLWPLADAPAARFQVAFYKTLLEGKRPAASLSQVQRACIEGALGPQMRDPSTWAAYVVYGVN